MLASERGSIRGQRTTLFAEPISSGLLLSGPVATFSDLNCDVQEYVSTLEAHSLWICIDDRPIVVCAVDAIDRTHLLAHARIWWLADIEAPSLSEAVSSIARFLFDYLPLRWWLLETDQSGIESAEMLQSAGFQRIATFGPTNQLLGLRSPT